MNILRWALSKVGEAIDALAEILLGSILLVLVLSPFAVVSGVTIALSIDVANFLEHGLRPGRTDTQMIVETLLLCAGLYILLSIWGRKLFGK